MPVLGVLEGDQADGGVAGGERGVEAGPHLGGDARARGVQVVDDDRSTGGQRLAQRFGQRGGGVGRGRAGAVRPLDDPRLVGVVEDEHGDAVGPEQVPEPGERGVERLLDVERGGQGLGDAVQRVEEEVGVGEATEAVEGQGVLAVGLAGDAPGVAGDEGDEDQPHGPLDRGLHGVGGAVVEQERDRHGTGGGDGDPQGEAEPAGEPGDHHRRDDREHERRVPVAGGDDRADVDADLDQHPDDAGGVVDVADRLDDPEDVVEHEDRADADDQPVRFGEVGRGERDRHGGAAAATARIAGRNGSTWSRSGRSIAGTAGAGVVGAVIGRDGRSPTPAGQGVLGRSRSVIGCC